MAALFICIIRRSKRSPAVFHCRTDCKLCRSRLFQSGNVFSDREESCGFSIKRPIFPSRVSEKKASVHVSMHVFRKGIRRVRKDAYFNKRTLEERFAVSVDMWPSPFSDALFCSLSKFTFIIYHYLFLLSSTVRIELLLLFVDFGLYCIQATARKAQRSAFMFCFCIILCLSHEQKPEGFS